MSGTPDIDGYHPPRRGPVRVDPTPRGLGLLRRLLLYHLTLGVVAVVLVSVVPALTAQLPIGGVRILAEGSGLAVEDPAAAAGPGRFGYARQLVFALVGIWLLMLPVSWVHRGIHRSSTFDHSLDKTTMILPDVVASIVLVVQYSLALAFALAGVVAGVQFRRSTGNTTCRSCSPIAFSTSSRPTASASARFP